MSQPTASATAFASPVVSNDALLFLSEGHSIYEGTRMWGEQVRRHVLPIDALAETAGRSNDDDADALYARAMLGLLASPSSSHL